MPAFVLSLMIAAATAAPDAPPRRLGLCEACHGRDGRARTPDAPHLGGQNEAYMKHALQQYRDGGREAPAMNAIAAMLSPDDIDALSRWYAGQPWPSNHEPER